MKKLVKRIVVLPVIVLCMAGMLACEGFSTVCNLVADSLEQTWRAVCDWGEME